MKAKKIILAALAPCLLCLSLSSCDDSLTTTTTTIQQNIMATFYYDTNAGYYQYVTNGFTLEWIVTVYEEKSTDEINIDKVEYYWDDELIQTATDAEHKLSWLVENQSLGDHILTYKIYYEAGIFSDLDTSFSSTLTVVETMPVIDFAIDYPEELSIGETFVCTVGESDETTLDVAIDRVSFYWDGEMLMNTSVPPYELSYPMAGQTVGEHTLEVETHFSGEWNGTITRPYTITVTE